MTHPLVADALVAVFLTAAYLLAMIFQEESNVVGRNPDVLSAVIGSVAMLSLALRRRFPVRVLGFVVVTCVVLVATGYDFTLGPGLAYLIALYTGAPRTGGWRRACRSGRSALVGLHRPDGAVVDSDFWQAVSNTVLFAGIWWLGRSLRLRRAYLDELEARAQRLERAREADARAARAEERVADRA